MNETLPEPSTPAAPPHSPPAGGGRRRITLGVAAGVLAGGVIGLVATTPGWSSAATDAGSIVALQEDTSTDETSDDTQVPEERPEPGERLRETLQPLVDDGTIDATQADAVTEHLVENRPERRGRHARRVLRADAVAELIGIDRETLRAELEAGQSIADVAEANGVDVQTVIDGLIAEAQNRIDAAIERGLDEERAAERLEKITERIEEGVERTRDAAG